MVPQAPAAEQQATSFWQWLLDLCQRPGVLEILLAGTVVGAVAFVWWRLARLVTGARSRQAIEKYLLGVEQALHGDLRGAHERLQQVIAEDPENHYARLLLGKVLAELGEPAQAHTQHLYLQRAFGIESTENDLLLAQSLLGAGLATEAAEAAERALLRTPESAQGWEFVYRARLQTGDFEGAATAGRRLLDLVREGPRRVHLSTDIARTLAQSGGLRLQHGDHAGATAALQQARRLHSESEALPLLAARLDAVQAGVERTVQTLLADNTAPAEQRTGNDLPIQLPARLPRAAENGLPMATLAGLVPRSRWSCRACGLPLPRLLGECPRCQAKSPGRLQEPQLVAGIESPMLTMDSIDVNDAYVQRLVRTLIEGEGESRAQARAHVLELREQAVEELLRQVWHQDEQTQEAAVDVLRAMGPSIAPYLFAASDTLERERLLSVGSRSPTTLVGRIVQGFDRTAMPHMAPLFTSARPEHRKILIDFFLGLADLEQFQLVLERFPPMEILHRLNKADAVVLRRFLQAVPQGHFVAETLLVESTFYRDEEVFAAIPGAAHPDVLCNVLLQRGPTRALTRVLISGLADPALADVAERVIGQLGESVLDHVLAAYTDPERRAEERVRLATVLARGGVAAVERICASFGPEPSALDDELRAILKRIGDGAVAALQAAYGHSGWLEKVSIGLISRHTNRRVQIARALRDIGSPLAITALLALLEPERDPNLRLRLQGCLHELGVRDREGGPHGQGR
ncbi:MAG TPA: tetratricopeptide repeat protein [Planctomycetota bacterium]|nr:tetratricopeptide repeat protein [Planctomycetota bacterium]